MAMKNHNNRCVCSEYTMRLSTTFPSIKKWNPSLKSLKLVSEKSSLSPPKSSPTSKSDSDSKSWSIYLIISTNPPIKTYVGATIDFCRRLKQHNGQLKGGAKASRGGRPWVCACLIRGFKDQSEACSFETKWKSFSRKLPRQKKNEESSNQTSDGSLKLLQHRQKALNRVMCSMEYDHVEIDWKMSPS